MTSFQCNEITKRAKKRVPERNPIGKLWNIYPIVRASLHKIIFVMKMKKIMQKFVNFELIKNIVNSYVVDTLSSQFSLSVQWNLPNLNTHWWTKNRSILRIVQVSELITNTTCFDAMLQFYSIQMHIFGVSCTYLVERHEEIIFC